MPPRIYLFLFVGILPLVALGFYMVTLFPELPERVATHWDWRGTANGWMSREHHYQFLSMFVGGMNLILLLTHWIPPRFLRFPHKKEWLSHPPFQREMKTRLGTGLLAAMAVVNWITLAAFHLTVSQAVPHATPIFPISVGQFVTICLLVTVSFLIWFYRLMRLPQLP